MVNVDVDGVEGMLTRRNVHARRTYIHTHRKNNGFVTLVDSLAALQSHGADVTDIDGITRGKK